MTNLKRILCLVLVLVFAAGLISCDQNTNKPSNTDPSDTTPKEETPSPAWTIRELHSLSRHR